MDAVSCEMCQNLFNQETCVPRVLKCGNSLCSSCIKSLLLDEKNCPKCNACLTKSWEDNPINISLLKISESFKEGFCLDLHNTCSLETKNNILIIKREMLEKSIEKRSSLRKETVDYIRIISEMKQKEKDFSYTTRVRELISEIETHIEKVDNVLYCGCNPDSENFLYFDEYSNPKHFLYDLAVRVQNGEKIYVCDVIGDLGWKYGKISFKNGRLIIHILCDSFISIIANSTLVLLQDIRKCLNDVETIMPFIRVGSEEMIFNLTGESSIATTLHLIKFVTGESGHLMKDINIEVKEYISTGLKTQLKSSSQSSSGSAILNFCIIEVSSSPSGCGYEHAFYIEDNSIRVMENETILQIFNGCIHIRKITKNLTDRDYYDVVAKLHEDCDINFNNMLNQKVEDCGISFFL